MRKTIFVGSSDHPFQEKCLFITHSKFKSYLDSGIVLCYTCHANSTTESYKSSITIEQLQPGFTEIPARFVGLMKCSSPLLNRRLPSYLYSEKIGCIYIVITYSAEGLEQTLVFFVPSEGWKVRFQMMKFFSEYYAKQHNMDYIEI
jgi:hypothetical protein